jgi:hypothetical protein
MTNVDTLKALMSAQNKYLEDIVNIPVIGIPPKAFEIPESDEDNSSKLMNMINNSELFWGVEETPQSKYLGKYHFITDIENEAKGKYFTDNHLKHWIELNMDEVDMIQNLPEARRTAMPSASPMVGNYAAALKMRMENTTEEEISRKVPEKAKRRRTNIVHFGAEEFPAMGKSDNSDKSKTSNKQQKKTKEARPSESNAEDTDKTDFQKKLEKSEESFQAQLKATTESTDRKLIAMSNDHAKNLETQAATFKTMLDDQAAANKAMIESINQSNQMNQTEMREQQKQNNDGLKDLMTSMIGALKAELTTIISGNQQVAGAANQPVQPPPYNATNTGLNSPGVYASLRPNGHVPTGNPITPAPPIHSNHNGVNQLQQAAYQYLNPSSFVAGFSPPPSMLRQPQQQDTTMHQQVQHNGQHIHSHEYGNANMEHSPSRGASN